MIQEKISDVQSGYDRIADEYARRMFDEVAAQAAGLSAARPVCRKCAPPRRCLQIWVCGPGHVAHYLQGRGIEVWRHGLVAGKPIQRAQRLNTGNRVSSGRYARTSCERQRVDGYRGILCDRKPAFRRSCAGAAGDDASPHPRWPTLCSASILAKTHPRWKSFGTLGLRSNSTSFCTGTVAGHMRGAGFEIEEIVEREPYAPDVEFQSRRAYIFAHKPMTKITSA